MDTATGFQRPLSRPIPDDLLKPAAETGVKKVTRCGPLVLFGHKKAPLDLA